MVCDFWECQHGQECRQRFTARPFPPCPMCPSFDKCSVCSKYIECCDLIRKYAPNFLRRLVREIRHGEDIESTEQVLRRKTKGKKY